jgi:hypothetical protein
MGVSHVGGVDLSAPGQNYKNDFGSPKFLIDVLYMSLLIEAA